ncbi:hypothetical protein K438DRAFT_1765327 [Mycena galopus ATCC 62051]|nr:hypothetical protein K438DRAFT_1765327 [Mycena galopus ATCC 62051]
MSLSPCYGDVSPLPPLVNSDSVSTAATGGSCPFDSVPNDVMLRILDITVASRPSDLEAVRKVCRQWRAIVRDSAACNRRIDFEFNLWTGNEDELVPLHFLAQGCRLSVEQARSALLDVRFCVDLGPFGWDPGHFCVQQVLHEIDRLCDIVAPRTRSLEVIGSRHIVAPLFAHSWPFLLDLSSQLYGDPSGLLDHVTFLVLRLTHLSTSFIYFLFDRHGLQPPYAHQISSLELFTDCDPAPAEATLSTLLFVLTSFPNLRRLRTALDDVVFPAPSGLTPFRHNMLRELYLSSSRPPTGNGWIPAWVLSTLWSYFDAPAITELSIPQRWFVMGAQTELGDFFARNRRPCLILFVECSPSSMDLWQARHQEEWADTIVMVRRMDASRS